MIRRFFIAINVILFLLSLFFLIKTATDKKEINRYYGEKFSYTETAGGEVELEMSDGETVRLRFDKEVVKAEQSYRVKDRAGQIYLTTFIYSYAREKEIHIERKFTDMLGELRLTTRSMRSDTRENRPQTRTWISPRTSGGTSIS